MTVSDLQVEFTWYEGDVFVASSPNDWVGKNRMIKLSSGVLVSMYGSGGSHGDVAGHPPHLRFSEDSGETWTEEDTFTDGNPCTGIPTVAVAATAAIIETMLVESPDGAVWMMVHEGDRLGLRYGTQAYKSVDGGKNWTSEGKVAFSNDNDDGAKLWDTELVNGTTYFTVIIDANADMAAPFRTVLYKCLDSDFTTLTHVSNITENADGTNETALFYLADSNEFCCVMRTTSGSGSFKRISSSVSELGDAWGPLEVTNDTLGGVYTPLGYRDTDNVLWLMHRAGGERNVLRYSHDGQTWSDPQYPQGPSRTYVDCGYINIAEISPGRFYAQAYTGTDDVAEIDSFNFLYFEVPEVLTHNRLFGRGSYDPDEYLDVNWKLQETTGVIAVDDSSNSRNGTITGMGANPTTVTGPTEWLPSALRFDGSNDYIDAGEKIVGPGNKTLFARVKFDALTGSQRWFGQNGNTEGDFYIRIDGAEGRIVFFRLVGGTTDFKTWTSVSLTVSAGEWHNITVVYAQTELSVLFVLDGVSELITSSSSGGTTQSNHDFAVGKWGTNFFDGDIADTGVFSRALTANEIAEWEIGPEPLKSGGSSLVMHLDSFSGTVETYDSQDNGTVSVDWELRLAADDSVVESGTTTNGGSIGSSGTYSGEYYLWSRGTNDGGYDPEEDAITSPVLAEEGDLPVIPTSYVGTRPVIKSYIGSQLVTATH